MQDWNKYITQQDTYRKGISTGEIIRFLDQIKKTTKD